MKEVKRKMVESDKEKILEIVDKISICLDGHTIADCLSALLYSLTWTSVEVEIPKPFLLNKVSEKWEEFEKVRLENE